MIDREHPLSVARQTKLLDISRGAVYYRPRLTSDAVVCARGHQLGDTVDQLQRREGDLFGLCTALIVGEAAGLAVLLGAAVDQLTARLAKPLTRERWTRTVAQQTLQASTVLRRMYTLVSTEKPLYL